MIWIEQLHELPSCLGLAEAVAWLASREVADREAARPTPEDLADAAPLGSAQGAASLLRRTLLRALAARALGCAPEAAAFARDEAGRVRLTAPTAAHASAASRAGWSVAALGPRPIGVDVDEAAPEPPLPLDLLHPSERARLAALPDRDRAPAFARLWVSKECYAKASGLSLEAALAGEFRASTFRVAGSMIAAAVEL